ncbi:hypothetical protein HY604_04270 [Candidatus Peregrinibacteria bacterium]|nr:hypothetical protein [Candidatus Peregrinibacteria bacterium]
MKSVERAADSHSEKGFQDALLGCVASFYGAFTRAFPAKPSKDGFGVKELPGLDFNEDRYNQLWVLAMTGQFSQEEMDELNAVLETGVLSANELVELYGSIKIQALMDLKKRKYSGTEPKMEHILRRYRKILDFVHKGNASFLDTMVPAVKAVFLKARILAVNFPELFDSLFARVYREVEIFDQRSEVAGQTVEVLGLGAASEGMGVDFADENA